VNDGQANTPQSTAVAGRDERGRFRPGASGNPGGRRPSLAALIRTRTRAGASLVRFLLATMRDEAQSTRDRLRAAELLLGYGFSKPVPAELLEAAAPTLTLEAARALIAHSRAERNGEALGSH
jgi:hypothetical protein